MKYKTIITDTKTYVEKDIWHQNLNDLPKYKSFGIKLLRIISMAYKGFNEDGVQLRSSALTYYSLLSIVPIVAMAFGIAKGFGMDDKLNELLIEKLSSHQEIMDQVISFANTLLNNTKGGVVAGVGVALLFWSVLKVMGNIEESFNAIWGITKGRTLIKKFTEYLSIMLLAPILLILSSSATVFISSKTKDMADSVGVLGYIESELSFLLSLSPYIIFWLLLTMVYMIMPNTKVKFKSALIAGVISGTMFVLVQWAYVTFQIGVVQFNAIYGSFAALPLFLVWLRTSWIIVLFGAELSFVHQNVEQYLLKEESRNISLSFKKKLSIYITHYVVKKFYNGKAPSIDEIKQDLHLPFRLVAAITEDLVDSNIFSRIENDKYKLIKYQPAVDTSKITINYILLALDKLGADEIPEPDNKVYALISEKIDAILLEGDNLVVKEL